MTSGGTVELQSLGKHHKQHLNSGRVTLNDKFERWGGIVLPYNKRISLHFGC